MKTKKMSIANIRGKLSRSEMKNIMAGSGSDPEICECNSPDDCTEYNELCMANSECDRSGGKQGMCGCIS